MAIRLSGMSSGLDTDAIVKAMVAGYTQKKEKYQKAQTKLSWQQDAWKSVNSKVYSLYSSLDSLRFSSGYALKKTTVSDSTKAKVTASSTAFNGTQKLNVVSTAKAGNMTGAKLDSGTKGNTTLAELGYTGSNGTIDLKLGDGTTKSIEVSQATTVNQFVNSLKDAGLSANFDTTQNRIYINSKKEGAASDFTLTGANADGFKALTALGVNFKSTASDAAYSAYSQYSGANDTLTKDNIVSALNSYKDAQNTVKLASAQNSNLTAAYSYIDAYKGMRDTFSELGLDFNNDTDGTVKNIRTLFNFTQNEANNSILDADGNVYSKMDEKDKDGNPMYKYTDSLGNDTIITGITKYTGKAEDETEYNLTKNADGKYEYNGHELTAGETENGYTKYTYTDGEGEHELSIKVESKVEYYTGATAYDEVTGYKGSDEKEYSKYSDSIEFKDGEGNTQTVSSDIIYKNGDDLYLKDDTGKLTKLVKNDDDTYSAAEEPEDGWPTLDMEQPVTKTAYTVADQTPASEMKTPNQFMDGILEKLQEKAIANAEAAGETLSEEDAKSKVGNLMGTLQSYVYQVDEFEEMKQDEVLGTVDSPGDFSKWDIMNDVAGAYDAGGESLAALKNTYTEKIQTNKTEINTANETISQYSNLDALSKLEVGSDAYNNALDALVAKALNAKDIESSGAGYNTGAMKVDGSDAEITLNGISYKSSSNSFSINGLSIQALQETGEDEKDAITITTQNDTQGLYDKVKDFISTYNDIINELTSLYNAPSSKGYEPLTDDEKAEMSDKQVEQWETKIKDSLFRRDQTLGSIITTMTNAMSKTYSIDGKSYSLASFGIKTMGILNSPQNKQNAYHIDGDEDDSLTSAKEDKLMAMLTGDPDKVTTFLQKLTNGLHDELDKKMRGTTMKSAYTIYNDKEMAKEYSSYNKLIKQWETRASDAEERYNKQFTNMEKALTKLQGTTSSLSGMFG